MAELLRGSEARVPRNDFAAALRDDRHLPAEALDRRRDVRDRLVVEARVRRIGAEPLALHPLDLTARAFHAHAPRSSEHGLSGAGLGRGLGWTARTNGMLTTRLGSRQSPRGFAETRAMSHEIATGTAGTRAFGPGTVEVAGVLYPNVSSLVLHGARNPPLNGTELGTRSGRLRRRRSGAPEGSAPGQMRALAAAFRARCRADRSCGRDGEARRYGSLRRTRR